jgi:dephospho-CoA kinase
MLRIGLTGGYATGKSYVGALLAEFGCHLIRADDLGHEALAPDGEAYPAVIEAFGEGILLADRSIDRRALGGIVFADPEKLALLNKLVHPCVFQRQQELIQALEATDPDGIVVVEAAIMYETGSHTRYEKMIVATCGLEEQIRRAMARDGLPRERVLERIQRQIPLEEKARMADFVIDTSGTKDDTRRQTLEVWSRLRQLRTGMPVESK